MFRQTRHIQFFVFVCGVSLCGGAHKVLAQAPEASATLNLEEERARLITHLKTQVEPSLLERDLKRLRRDVMRLGSFRAEWARESEKFLIENSALAELFLYDFSRIRNPRLNERILETLMKFSSFQNPTAVIAFESDLSVNPRGRALVYQLMAKVIKAQPQSWGQLSGWVLSQSDNTADYFQVLLSACRSGSRLGGETRTFIGERLSSAPQDFWSRLVVDDLRTCLRGS